MVTRILLLLSITWIMGLTKPLFTVRLGAAISGRDLILLVGGLFLVAKATHEIHDKLEGHEGEKSAAAQAASFGAVLAPDHAPRHRLLARLRHHRGGHGGADRRS